MPDTELLYNRPTILSDRKCETGDIWHAHYGAAAIAAACFCAEQKLASTTVTLIAKQVRELFVKLVSPVDRTAYLPIEQVFGEEGHAETDWDFGHLFKFSYSFYDHLSRVEKGNDTVV